MIILVSACLLGTPCRYDGKRMQNDEVLALAAAHTLIPLCPEMLGGLPSPREPAERRYGLVINRRGEDVTSMFSHGANETVRLARLCGVQATILKQNSPSCGCGFRYDGTFRSILIPGNGMTAERLIAAGIPVYPDTAIDVFRRDFGLN